MKRLDPLYASRSDLRFQWICERRVNLPLATSWTELNLTTSVRCLFHQVSDTDELLPERGSIEDCDLEIGVACSGSVAAGRD